MTNDKQQTAVESIKTTFFHYAEPYPYFSEQEKWVITKEELFEVLEQAKEMEKQQREKDFVEGYKYHSTVINEFVFDEISKIAAKNGFELTYGGNK